MAILAVTLILPVQSQPQLRCLLTLVQSIQKLPLGLLNTLDIVNMVAILSESDFMGLSSLPNPV